MSDPVSLFEPVEGAWVPTDWARGPWSPDALHGGPTAALLAGETERAGDAAAPDGVRFQPARLSVELLRPVPVAPLSVRADVTRPGRKVQMVDADVRTADGTVVASARLLRVRDDDVPAPVTTTGLAAPPPPDAPAQTRSTNAATDAYEAFHSHGVEHRFVAGNFMDVGPATDWIRLRVPVAPGVEPTPLQRVAAAADFGNGVSRVVDFTELLFINPDLTIHLHREPAGEWVCIDAVTWMEERGLALAESRLWDERGPIGRSLQSLLIDRRAP
ncbi:MAG: thioesterase family protein [Acidimicrobiia bacterium]|nr:thioesterase family protein [Acidimicrobiia bacterium]